ncbi:glycoside hydrolase family 15 protein [Auriscalpium vulgare]|uniref:Glycoside hydrolase family 15 protein n=1 Tax=Auriscalpium vulgare TaxID=40419 RepID=A0ACB8SC48_9AGAM|nr:glycoside hydrolase family 15 protein [Auriscalpium vulgare]
MQPGVIATTIPAEGHPESTVYWVRDGCLVYEVWLNELIVFGDTSVRPLIEDAVHTLIKSQHVVSLSGNIFTGGLAESAFNLDLSAIFDANMHFGSPGGDVAPFRAAVLIKYAEWLLTQDNGTWVADNLWPAINLDLQWTALHWNESSFDLWWPPVWSGSFWTSSMQHRALRAGARLARTLGRESETLGYDQKAALVLDYLQSFWNEEKGYIAETTITDMSMGRSGIGSAPLTVTILNYDQSLGCDAATFQPCSDRALSTLKAVSDAYRKKFPIVSKDIPDNQPGYFGFYLEDGYIGGHPQFAQCMNQAEQLYDALSTWEHLGGLQVTDVSLDFFRMFDVAVKTGDYAKSSRTYKRLTTGIKEYADKAIEMLIESTPEDFVLPECVHKITAEPYGLRGTTRSLLSALTVADARSGLVPPSWSNGPSADARGVVPPAWNQPCAHAGPAYPADKGPQFYGISEQTVFGVPVL